MKRCSRCTEYKKEENFNWKVKGKRRQSLCKDCNKIYNKKHYQDNKEVYKAKARIWSNNRRLESSENLKTFLEKNPCVDCDNCDIRVLEFDHVGVKTCEVSKMISDGYAWEKILLEIAECEVRCANCHRIVTQVRGNTLRSKW